MVREAPALLLLGMLGVIAVACLLLLSMPMVPGVLTRAPAALVSSGVGRVDVVVANPYEQNMGLNVLLGNETSLEVSLAGLAGLAVNLPAGASYSYSGCILPGDVIDLVRSTRHVNLEVLGSISERLVKCGARRLDLREYVSRYVQASDASIEIINSSTLLVHGLPGEWNVRFTNVSYARFKILPADGIPVRYFKICYDGYSLDYGVFYSCMGCNLGGCWLGDWCISCSHPTLIEPSEYWMLFPGNTFLSKASEWVATQPFTIQSLIEGSRGPYLRLQLNNSIIIRFNASYTAPLLRWIYCVTVSVEWTYAWVNISLTSINGVNVKVYRINGTGVVPVNTSEGVVWVYQPPGSRGYVIEAGNVTYNAPDIVWRMGYGCGCAISSFRYVLGHHLILHVVIFDNGTMIAQQVVPTLYQLCFWGAGWYGATLRAYAYVGNGAVVPSLSNPPASAVLVNFELLAFRFGPVNVTAPPASVVCWWIDKDHDGDRDIGEIVCSWTRDGRLSINLPDLDAYNASIWVASTASSAESLAMLPGGGVDKSSVDVRDMVLNATLPGGELPLQPNAIVYAEAACTTSVTILDTAGHRILVEPRGNVIRVAVGSRSETLPCKSGYKVYWLPSGLVTVETDAASTTIAYTPPVGTVRLEANGDAWMGLLPAG